MGLWDFAKKALGALNINVSHSPILNGLGSLAGMVSQAIPFVRPIIDKAVPALQGIFSDSASQGSAGTFSLEPVLTNLKQTNEQIETVLEGVKNVGKALKDGFEDMKLQIQKLSKDVQDKIDHNTANTCLGNVQTAYWLASKQEMMKTLTAKSGDEKFNLILQGQGGALALGGQRQKLADHALTGFFSLTKLIVTLGLQARAKFAHGLYREYITLLGQISQNIIDLQTDTIKALKFLTDLSKNIRKDRAQAFYTEVVTDGKKLRLGDNWAIISVGGVPRDTIIAALGEGNALEETYSTDTVDEATKSKFLTKAGPMFYKEAALRALDAYLEPTERVIADLTESLKQWNNRLPLTPPVKKDSKAYVESKLVDTAISLDQSVKAGHVIAPASQGEKDAEGEWAGHKVYFAITYINDFGESAISDWGKGVETPSDRSKPAQIILTLAPVAYAGDPLADLEPLEIDGDPVPPTKSIRRRVYMKYTKNEIERYRIIGEVAELQDTLLWNLN